jgi:hypothetical protein
LGQGLFMELTDRSGDMLEDELRTNEPDVV